MVYKRAKREYFKRFVCDNVGLILQVAQIAVRNKEHSPAIIISSIAFKFNLFIAYCMLTHTNVSYILPISLAYISGR